MQFDFSIDIFQRKHETASTFNVLVQFLHTAHFKATPYYSYRIYLDYHTMQRMKLLKKTFKNDALYKSRTFETAVMFKHHHHQHQ
jgi:hypothetical protein